MRRGVTIKIIFLDVDGVLNCRTSQSRCRGYIGIDNSKVKVLKRIVAQTNARIVLCSTWKMGWERVNKEEQDFLATYLDKELKRENLYIFDKTVDKGSNRGKGILDWLKRHNVESWIVIDDEIFKDYETCGILPRLVMTSFYVKNGGLQDKHADLGVRLLNTVSN